MSVSDIPVTAVALEPTVSRGGRLRLAVGRRVGLVPVVAVIAIGILCTFAPAVIVARDAAHRGDPFLGVTGIWPMDQLQYLSWIVDAGAHGLIRNLYGLGGKAVFVHPLFTPLGLLHAHANLSLAATMVLSQAIGLVVLLAGCIRLIWSRLGHSAPSRRAPALALCLFGGLTPMVAALPLMDPFQSTTHYTDAAGALLSITALWAYAPLAIAIGLMPFAIDDLERLIAGRSTRKVMVRASLLGMLISWLHPWQGEELLMMAVGLVTWEARPTWTALRQRLRNSARWELPRGAAGAQLVALVAFATATVLPVLYYGALSRFDIGWRTSAHASVGASLIPFAVLVTCLAPLGLLMILAVRRIELDRTARVLMLWPLSCLLAVLLTPNGQYRALAGMALPLAVLAVRAWPVLAPRRRWLLGVVATIAALAGGAPFVVNALRNQNGPNVPQYTELSPSEIHAASLAATHSDGRPILAPAAFGTAIPALLDARVWVGHPIWTPDHLQRDIAAQQLFTGFLTGPRARRFVSSTTTRAVVEPCAYGTDLEPRLAPLGFRETRIGCARVYLRGR